MPKWLQGMFLPTLMLWLYVIAFVVISAMHSSGSVPKSAELLARATLALILAQWVTADARMRQQHLCYDYDSFAFFAWPIVLPVYLFRTRGLRAFLTLLALLGSGLSP